MTEKRRPGRPSRYADSLVNTICLRIAGGESLRRICAEEGMPDKATVLRWLMDNRHARFRRRYGLAREAQADALADEVVDIADAAQDRDDAAVAKLRIDARKWVAAKLKPKKYGDRLDLRGSLGFHHEEALLALDSDDGDGGDEPARRGVDRSTGRGDPGPGDGDA